MKQINKRISVIKTMVFIAAGLTLGTFSNGYGQSLVSTSFTGQTLPTGWDTVSLGDGGEWAFDNPGSRTITNGSNTNFDSDFAIFDSDNWCGFGEDAELTTPSFDASSATGAIILSFDNQFRFYSFGDSEGEVQVWDGSTWTTVLTMTDSSDGYPDADHKSIDITAACGGSSNAKVRFHWLNGNCDWWWAIDNVDIENVTCASPTNISSSNITIDSATISWNAPSTSVSNGYQYYYSTSSTAPTSTTTASGSTTDTSVTLTGLSANTQYYVWVRSLCTSTDTSDWSSAFSFTTACGTITSLPWMEGFENTTVGNTPSCWYNEQGDWQVDDDDYYVTPHGGNNYLEDDWAAYNDYIWTPGFQLTAGTTYEYSFYMQGDGYTAPDWTVGAYYNTSQSSSGATQFGSDFSPSGPGYYTYGASPYTQEVFYFTPSTSGVYYFAVQVTSSGTPEDIAFDDFEVSVAPSCIPPDGLSVDSITTSSARLQWNTSITNPSNGYQYYYSTSSTAPTSTTTASGSTTDTSVTLTGLSANTQYYVWVRSLCTSTDTSDWSSALSFTTACGTITSLPWTEGFENTTVGNTPSCWYNEQGDWQVDDDDYYVTPHGGNNYLEDDWAAYNDYIWTPGFQLTAGTTYEYSFYMQGDGYTAPDWTVGAYYNTSQSSSGATQFGSDFSPSGPGYYTYGTSPYTQEVFYFTPSTSGVYYFAVQVTSSGTPEDIAFDDFEVQVVPSCAAPLGLHVTSITSSSARVGWDTAYTTPANGYQYYYSTSNIPPTDTTTASGSTTDTFVNLSGLSGSSHYYFWVRSMCSSSDTSAWSQVVDFVTSCGTITALPWTDGFENYSLYSAPDCWTNQQGDWEVDNDDYNVTPHSGNNYLEDDWAAYNDYIWTPGFQLTAGTMYEYSFYMQGDGYTYPDWIVGAYYNTSTDSTGATQFGSDFSPAGPGYSTYGASPYAQKIFYFTPSTSGVYYFAVKVTSDYTPEDIAFDDFEVSVAPSCIPPDGLSVDSITTSSARLQWNTSITNPSNGYQYYYSTSSTAPTATTTASGSTTDTFVSLSGLPSSTTYYVWVRSMCSATDSSDWSLATSFQTRQIPVTLPYQDGFSSSNWSILNTGQSNQWYIGSATGNPANSMYISDDGGTSNTYNNNATSVVQAYRDIVLPSGNDSFNLSFDWKCKGESSWDYFRVYVVPNSFVPTPGTQMSLPTGGVQLGLIGSYGVDGSNFNDPYGSGNWHTTNFVIPSTYAGDTVRLIFEWRNDGSGGNNPPAAIDNVDVHVICTPPVVNLGNDSAICAGNTVTLDAGNTGYSYTYLWNTGDTTQTITASTSGNYSVTVTNPAGAGCSTTDSVAITVNAVPTATASANGPLCAGSTLNLTSTGTGTYSWSGPNGFGSTQQNPSITTTTADSGAYTVTVTNASGCTDTASVIVAIHAIPVATASANSTSLCAGSTLNLTSTGVGTTYSWSGPNGFSSSQQNPSISSVTNADSGVYTVTITNASGCTDSASVTVAVHTVPAATASANDPLCAGSTLNLTATGTGSYSWSGPNGFSSSVQNPSITNAPTADSGVYTVTVTNAGGCSDTASVMVVVHAVPTATASSNGPICEGVSLNLTSTGSSSYSWSGPNGFSSTQQNPSISNATTAASGTYTVTVTNTSGCTDTASVTASVEATPVATASSNSPVCVGTSLNLATTGLGTYSWSGPNGFSSTQQNTTITSVTTADSGVYTVTVTNGGGCSDTASVIVAVHTIPAATASANGPLCAGSTLNLTATGIGSYNWSGPNGFSSTQQNPSITTTTADSGVYTVIVTNASACSDTASVSVTVNANPPSINLGNDTAFCSGNSITLQSGNTNMNNMVEWNDGSTLSTLMVDSTGQYYVTVTNPSNCSASDTINVTVHPSPNVINLGNDTAICEGTSITLQSGNTNPNASVLWSNGSTGDSLIVDSAGTYSVIVSNHFGCSSSDSIMIVVNPLPHVDSISFVKNGNGSYGFTANGVQNANTYDWNFGDSTQHTMGNIAPGHTFANDGTYTVMLIVSNDCGSDTATAVINYRNEGIHQIDLSKDELQLYPNPAIDRITLENKSPYKMKSVVVYNVLGQVIFRDQTDNTNVYHLNVQNYASGMYNVKVFLTNGSWVLRRFEIAQ